MHFKDIPLFIRSGSYMVHHSWDHFLETMDKYIRDYKLDMDPDFQRGHVWTEAQQIAYVEYNLRGPTSGLDIYTNCPGWQKGATGDFVIVDGKQRVTAALRFLRNEIPAFGTLYKDFKGAPRLMQGVFQWHVNDLKTRAEVLQWYLEMNTGGTPHTAAEIARVQALLDAERKA